MVNPLRSEFVQQSYDRFLTTLSNKTRLAIIHSLKDGSKNVNDITNEMKVHQTTVSHSLRRLLDCGFVFVAKNGKERVYSLNKKTIRPLIKLMEEHVNSFCTKGSCI